MVPHGSRPALPNVSLAPFESSSHTAPCLISLPTPAGNAMTTKPFKIAVPFGGKSAERGISLGSARTLHDHLAGDDIHLVFLYQSLNGKFYRLPVEQLYQNTPDDFEYRIQAGHFDAHAIESLAAEFTTANDYDLVFPAGHGEFFEDGTLQEVVEHAGIPHVGSSAATAATMFDKALAHDALSTHGFQTIPQVVLKLASLRLEDDLRAAMSQLCPPGTSAKWILKPSRSGSSIGVASVAGVDEAVAHCASLQKGGYSHVIVQPDFKANGDWKEFTVIVLADEQGQPAALCPSVIECDGPYTYRKKYLYSRDVRIDTPPDLPDGTTAHIQTTAERVFKSLNMRDFARIDGWIRPASSQPEVVISDLNVTTGMNQTSLFFMQAAHAGFTHRKVLRHLASCALARGQSKRLSHADAKDAIDDRMPMYVVFGGETNEQETSIESGVNVWLKLASSKTYAPSPWLLIPKDGVPRDYVVWQLPSAAALNHSAEDIVRACKAVSAMHATASRWTMLRQRFGNPTSASPAAIRDLDVFLQHAAEQKAYVFNAVHGGLGEDGRLQARIAAAGLRTNGSCAAVSRLCMDKPETSRFLADARIPGVMTSVAPGGTACIVEKTQFQSNATALWNTATTHLFDSSSTNQSTIQSDGLIVKPTSDGCSTGVARIASEAELRTYLAHLNKRSNIPGGTLANHPAEIEMPRDIPDAIVFERYCVTDTVTVTGQNISVKKKSGWVEVTIGVVGPHGRMEALPPSITVKHGDGVLTREDKFTLGVGVNLTPPPTTMISDRARQAFQQRVANAAKVLGLHGFARFDAFINTTNGEAYIIEVNTIPGMTPATVLFHQGIAGGKGLPGQLLEFIANS